MPLGILKPSARAFSTFLQISEHIIQKGIDLLVLIEGKKEFVKSYLNK